MRIVCLPSFVAALSIAAPEAVAAERSLVEQAQAEVDRASRHYTRGEFAEALEALRTAETLAERAEDPSLPSIRFNIARCLEKLERWDDALRAYERYNELPDASHRKQRAFEAIRALEGKVYATLAIACDPSGSTVEISGITEGTPSCPWRSTRIPPGAYAVKVSHPGYLPTTELIDLEVGRPFALEVSLERDPDAVMTAATAAPREPIRPWPWVALAGSAAALGVGAGFTVGALNERDAAENSQSPAEQDDAISAFETKRAISYVAYGVGGALAATGIALFLIRGNGDDRDEEPRVGVSAQGLTVRF